MQIGLRFVQLVQEMGESEAVLGQVADEPRTAMETSILLLPL